MIAKRNRTDALIRDIAKLFTLYPMPIWRPLIDELSSGGDIQLQVGRAIEEILKTVPKPKRPAAPSKSTKRIRAQPHVADKTTELPFALERADALRLLADELADRRALPRLSDVRRLYQDAGGKLEMPKERRAACGVLLMHLNEVSDDAFSKALVAIREDAADANAVDAYARWFRLIRPAGAPEQAREPAAKPVGPSEPATRIPPKKRPI